MQLAAFSGPDRHHAFVLLLALPTTQALLAVSHAGRDLAATRHPLPRADARGVQPGLVLRAHRFHRVREGADYLGVFLAALVSWVAVPGVGEAALIAAGISARHGHLDLTTVVALAFLGASLGGMAGWQIGRRGGRALVTAPGLLLRLRLSLVARGDRFYERYGPVAVLFTPSWMAGIHNMRWSRFLIANTISSLVWAAAIGVGADLLGPSVTDLVADAGTAGEIVLAVAVLGVAAIVLKRLLAGSGDGRP